MTIKLTNLSMTEDFVLSGSAEDEDQNWCNFEVDLKRFYDWDNKISCNLAIKEGRAEGRMQQSICHAIQDLFGEDSLKELVRSVRLIGYFEASAKARLKEARLETVSTERPLRYSHGSKAVEWGDVVRSLWHNRYYTVCGTTLSGWIVTDEGITLPPYVLVCVNGEGEEL